MHSRIEWLLTKPNLFSCQRTIHEIICCITSWIIKPSLNVLLKAIYEGILTNIFFKISWKNHVAASWMDLEISVWFTILLGDISSLLKESLTLDISPSNSHAYEKIVEDVILLFLTLITCTAISTFRRLPVFFQTTMSRKWFSDVTVGISMFSCPPFFRFSGLIDEFIFQMFCRPIAPAIYSKVPVLLLSRFEIVIITGLVFLYPSEYHAHFRLFCLWDEF